jgi:hypothetical protein
MTPSEDMLRGEALLETQGARAHPRAASCVL